MLISKLQQSLNQFRVTFINDLLILLYQSVGMVHYRFWMKERKLTVKGHWGGGANYEKVSYTGQFQEIKKKQII